MRTAEINRKTNETDIKIKLNIDGKGIRNINTGVGFFDHMLDLFAKHGLFDLEVTCKGDTYIDAHHTVEDVGIALGDAFRLALGDKKGIKRYGSFYMPMDETLSLIAVDLGGRVYLHYEAILPSPMLGEMASELVKEFFFGFSRALNCNLHIKLIMGKILIILQKAFLRGVQGL